MQQFYIIAFVFFILYLGKKESKNIVKVVKKRKKKEEGEMQELIKNFIDKICVIHTYNGTIIGTITHISDGAIQIKRINDQVEIINIDYIVRIGECPTNKKGKPKTIIFDE